MVGDVNNISGVRSSNENASADVGPLMQKAVKNFMDNLPAPRAETLRDEAGRQVQSGKSIISVRNIVSFFSPAFMALVSSNSTKIVVTKSEPNNKPTGGTGDKSTEADADIPTKRTSSGLRVSVANPNAEKVQMLPYDPIKLETSISTKIIEKQELEEKTHRIAGLSLDASGSVDVNKLIEAVKVIIEKGTYDEFLCNVYGRFNEKSRIFKSGIELIKYLETNLKGPVADKASKTSTSPVWINSSNTAIATDARMKAKQTEFKGKGMDVAADVFYISDFVSSTNPGKEDIPEKGEYQTGLAEDFKDTNDFRQIYVGLDSIFEVKNQAATPEQRTADARKGLPKDKVVFFHSENYNMLPAVIANAMSQTKPVEKKRVSITLIPPAEIDINLQIVGAQGKVLLKEKLPSQPLDISSGNGAGRKDDLGFKTNEEGDMVNSSQRIELTKADGSKKIYDLGDITFLGAKAGIKKTEAPVLRQTTIEKSTRPIVLVLDLSGSMGPKKMGQLRQFVKDLFIYYKNVAIITYKDNVAIVRNFGEMISDEDASILKGSVDKWVGTGSSSGWSAIKDSIQVLEKLPDQSENAKIPAEQSPLVLMVSDGLFTDAPGIRVKGQDPLEKAYITNFISACDKKGAAFGLIGLSADYGQRIETKAGDKPGLYDASEREKQIKSQYLLTQAPKRKGMFLTPRYGKTIELIFETLRQDLIPEVDVDLPNATLEDRVWIKIKDKNGNIIEGTVPRD